MTTSPANRLLAETFAPLVDLVYPPALPAVRRGFGGAEGTVCRLLGEAGNSGRAVLRQVPAPIPDGSELDGMTCGPCMESPPKHDGIAAGTLYNDTARQLVLNYKHGRRIALAPMLARLIAARVPVLEGEWLAVPVPLHRWRLWRRGFNQSALLAREMAKLTGAQDAGRWTCAYQSNTNTRRAWAKGAGEGA